MIIVRLIEHNFGTKFLGYSTTQTRHFLSEFVESLDCSAQIGYQPLLSLVICWVNPNKKSTMANRNNFAVLKHNYALTSQVSLNSLLSTLYHH